MAPVHQNTDASSRLANTLTNISNTSCVNSVKSSSSSSSGTSSSSRLCETNMNQLESTGVREDLLPITCRGSFYHDAFFKEARQHFDEAIKDVLDRWGHRSATMDDLTCYRKLRETNLREDNQAVTVSQNSHHHQVVIDVRDFLSGDVKVKVVDENEVVVEGSVEHTHQGSVSKKSFLRRFSFPGLVRPDAVTSTMSSDGVLTITVPKKEPVSHTTKVDTNKINTKVNSSTMKGAQKEKINKFTSHLHHDVNAQASVSKTTEKENKSKMSTHVSADNETTKITTNNGTKVKNSSLVGSSPEQTSDFVLPISHRGPFFHDSFFEEARQDFEASVKSILDTWGETPVSDHMSSYRRLRERDLKEENQAVSLTEDHQTHKVVIDVRDFLGGDVKVKVVDENEVVVEGSVEHTHQGSVSKKSFLRRFSFPGLVRPDTVTSTMSSDGVLTITVPKKEPVSHTTKVDTNKINTKVNSSTMKGTQNEKINKFTRHLHHDVNAQASVSKTTEKENKSKMSTHISADNETTKITTNNGTKVKNSSLVGSSPEQTSDFVLPISHRGPFFHDSFFEEARQDFEASVKSILDTWGETPVSDHMSSYRRLRERDLKEENQAVSLTEDHQTHKVVIDVRDFLGGDVKVKVVDENEVVVEGSVEHTHQGSVSKKSFLRRFSFPGLVRPDAVTSTMSSDGVLTITVPKKDEIKAKNTILDMTPNTNMQERRESSSVRGNSQHSEQSSLRRATAEAHGSSHNTEEKIKTHRSTAESSSIRNFINEASKRTEDIFSSFDQNETNNFTKNVLPWDLDTSLSISHKGLFFKDSFFQNARENFEAAVQEVLNKFGRVESACDDDLTTYRNLRESDLRDETQAMKVTENQDSHQVVMDVRDFLSGDVRVKAVGRNEVLVEGSVEKQEGCFKSTKSFSRRFTLPGVVNVNDVTSALSSDGVLTITAPKSTSDTSSLMTSAHQRTLLRQQDTSGTSCRSQQNYETAAESDEYKSHVFTKTSSFERFTSKNNSRN
nr:uncharacterized protein LOC128696305 [Cherax quadricarinatus]